MSHEYQIMYNNFSLFSFFIVDIMLFFILSLVFVVAFVFKDLLFRLYVIQLKEYRIDKLHDFFVTNKWYRQIFSKKNAFRLLMMMWIVVPLLFLEMKTSIIVERLVLCNVVIIMTFIDIVLLIIGRKNKTLKKPERTSRISLIWFVSMIFVIWIHYGLSYSVIDNNINHILTISEHSARYLYVILQSWILFVMLICIQLLVPCVVFVGHLFVSPLAYIQKQKILNDAKCKISHHNNITTIWIAWSYGKSSVKMLLSSLLASQHEHENIVLTTPGNVNTEIGISNYILWYLKPIHSYFVCEFGTYKIGESKLIGTIVDQKIWFLTGLNNQHVWLFGSLMNAIAAETEILLKLRENNGTIYANRDDHLVRSVPFEKVKLVKYSILDPSADVYVSDIQWIPGKYKFVLQMWWKSIDCYLFKTRTTLG